MSFSLRDWQKCAIANLLRVGSASGDEDGGDSPPSTWKVLLYDAFTRGIISPLLTVGELRAMGVTLHLSIDAPRDPIPDVSAVYFVRPSPASLRAIPEDAAVGRYRDFTLHFATPLSRAAMEALARGCVEAGASGRVRRVTDAWQSFVALEPRLFSLAMARSYAAYASPTATEAALRSYAEDVAGGIMSALGTCGAVPIIVSQPGGPSELVARALSDAIADHLALPGQGAFGAALGTANTPLPPLPGGRRAIPLGLGAGSRPVLILLDRGVDLATPLAHAVTYRALLDDMLGPIGANRVTLPAEGTSSGGGAGAGASGSKGGVEWLTDMFGGGSAAGGRKAGRSVPLDVDSDPFWRAHAGDDFPVAIEAHEAELSAVRSREAAVRATTTGGDAAAAAAALEADALASIGGGGDAAGGDDLTSAVDSLPALLRRKKVLETHATLLSGVMSRVAERLITHFVDAETPSRAPLERALVLGMLSDASQGSLDDRARLAVIHALTCIPGGAAAGGGEGGLTGASAAAALGEEIEACLAALRSSVAALLPAAPAAAGGAAAAPRDPVVAAATAAGLERAAAALAHARFLRSTPSLPSRGGAGGDGGGALGFGGAGMWGGMARATTSIFSRAAAAATRLVGGDDLGARPPVTRLVSAVCEGRPSIAGPALAPTLEAFVVLDPRAPHSAPRNYGGYLAAATAAANAAAGGSGAQPPGLLAAGAQFRNAFVFVTGGGCYLEYGDVQRYAATGAAGGASAGGTPGGARTIVYGATEMLHPPAFLSQLAELGARK